MLTAHRFPPGLSGIIPANSGGLGDPLKYREAYHADEVQPLRELIAETINADLEIWKKLEINSIKPLI